MLNEIKRTRCHAMVNHREKPGVHWQTLNNCFCIFFWLAELPPILQTPFQRVPLRKWSTIHPLKSFNQRFLSREVKPRHPVPSWTNVQGKVEHWFSHYSPSGSASTECRMSSRPQLPLIQLLGGSLFPTCSGRARINITISFFKNSLHQ